MKVGYFNWLILEDLKGVGKDRTGRTPTEAGVTRHFGTGESVS